MRFTTEQYEEAIENLRLAKGQLEPDSNCCSVCGDSGHMAFECGHNPLLAMWMCRQISNQSKAIHETLHELAGFNFGILGRSGPARITVPSGDEHA